MRLGSHGRKIEVVVSAYGDRHVLLLPLAVLLLNSCFGVLKQDYS
jgi:hypothetical protein